MKITPGSIVADGDEHIVLVGPITGSVTLDDGSVIDVSAPAVVARDQEHADQIAHAVGLHYQENGHPSDPNFVYTPPSEATQPDGQPEAQPVQPDPNNEAVAQPAPNSSGLQPAPTQEG